MSSNMSTTSVGGGGPPTSTVSRKPEGRLSSSPQSLLDELRSFDKEGFLDLGHPLLNRIAHSFITAAGIGAVQAVSREAYLTAVEGARIDSGSKDASASKQRLNFPGLRGATSRKSIEALVKNTGKESLQWGLAAGVLSGLSYGMTEARGYHDWKNSAVSGALAGVTMALTTDNTTHEQVVRSAITGAALATAANLLAGIF